MKKRTYLLIASAVLLLAAGVGIVSYQRTAAQPRDIVIAQVGDFFLYLPLYVAQDKGFFAEHGLKVKIISTGGDEKTWAAVVSGSAQFGVGDPTFVAISAERGQPGKVIASLVNGVPFWGITKKKEVQTLNSPRDLDSLVVATFPSPSTAYTLQRKMFQDAGLKPNIRQAAFGTLLPLLESGQVDIALELEPNVSLAVSQGARVVYSLAQVYGDFAITGLTTTDTYLAKDADAAQRVVNAIGMAESYIHANPDDALRIAAKRFPEVPHGVASQALDRVSREGIIPKTPVLSEVAWQKAIQLRLDVGDLKRVGPMNSYVNNSFAGKASAR